MPYEFPQITSQFYHRTPKSKLPFAGLTGDYDPQYVDVEFARGSMFGERIAPGMLVLTIAFGLCARDWHRYKAPKSKIAGRLYDKATFFVPVKIGDTIRCRHKTAASRVSKSRPEAGVVTYELQVVNQRNEVVQEGTVILMIPSRAGLHIQSTA